MTRKDYELIAATIRDQLNVTRDNQTDFGFGAFEALQELTDRLSTKFAHENPRFDGRIFRQACGF